MEFRKLRADEIDVRVASVGKSGCSLLLYKDARCDMNILDETVGSLNWQRQHSRENANCIVSIWDENKKQWISKEDTGTESYAEKEKGLASDSFKRACFNWGIGRELYTAPFIFAKVETELFKDKFVLKDKYIKFKIQSIDYENGVISKLVIVDDKGNFWFTFGNNKPVKKKDAYKEFVDKIKDLTLQNFDEFRNSARSDASSWSKEEKSAFKVLLENKWKELNTPSDNQQGE